MNPSRPTKQATRLDKTFAGLINEKNWRQKFDQHRVFPAWDQLVDGDTAAHARPLKVVKNVLWLEVDNSAWMQQLQFQKIVLLETLNDFLQHSRFSDIRFTLATPDDTPRPKKEAVVRFVPPPTDEIERFREQISFIEDEPIRESLMRLWYLAHACQKEEG